MGPGAAFGSSSHLTAVGLLVPGRGSDHEATLTFPAVDGVASWTVHNTDGRETSEDLMITRLVAISILATAIFAGLPTAKARAKYQIYSFDKTTSKLCPATICQRRKPYNTLAKSQVHVFETDLARALIMPTATPSRFRRKDGCGYYDTHSVSWFVTNRVPQQYRGAPLRLVINGGVFTRRQGPRLLACNMAYIMDLDGIYWPNESDLSNKCHQNWRVFRINRGRVTINRLGDKQPPLSGEAIIQGAGVLLPIATATAERADGCGILFKNVERPRTILGVAGHRLMVVAIDGDRGSVPRHATNRYGGATADQARTVMQLLGATHAIMLDGGGSTTMWTPAGLVSKNSAMGKAQRKVLSVIAIYAR